MKPPVFDYVAPASLEEAIAAIGESDDAKVIAGGQSLVPLLSFRLAAPDLLVDLRAIASLAAIEDHGDRVSVGAMVTQLEAERSELLASKCPLLGMALGHVAHPQIRARGTVGGSLAHADPAAELPAVLLALDGSVRVDGPRGSRRVTAEELFVAMLTTSLTEDEILVSIDLPVAGPNTGAGCSEVSRRRGDYALCGAVTKVSVADGEVRSAAVAYFGVGDRPLRSDAVEQAAIGRGTEEAADAAAEAAVRELEVKGDATVPADYRRQLAATVTERSLTQALEKAR